MSIELPYPDGLFIEEVELRATTGQPGVLVTGQPNRVYLAVSTITGGVVGFSGEISFPFGIGMPMPPTGKLEWRWETSGPLCTNCLFADDGLSGIPWYIETVTNWPAGTFSKGELIRRNRLRRRKAAATVRRLQRIFRSNGQTPKSELAENAR